MKLFLLLPLRGLIQWTLDFAFPYTATIVSGMMFTVCCIELGLSFLHLHFSSSLLTSPVLMIRSGGVTYFKYWGQLTHFLGDQDCWSIRLLHPTEMPCHCKGRRSHINHTEIQLMKADLNDSLNVFFISGKNRKRGLLDSSSQHLETGKNCH